MTKDLQDIENKMAKDGYSNAEVVFIKNQALSKINLCKG